MTDVLCSFRSDASFKERYKLIGKTVISLLLVEAVLLQGHKSDLATIFSVILVLLLLLNIVRLRWGDEVKIDADMLSIFHKGNPTKQIYAAAVVSGMAKRDTLALSYISGDKRQTIILPAESFSTDTYKLLQHAFIAFVPPGIFTDKR